MKRLALVLLVVLAGVGALSIATGYTRSTQERKWVVEALEELITDAAAIEVDVAALEVDLAAIEAALAPGAKAVTWFDKPVATPDTSVPLAAATANVRAAWMVARRTDGANTGTVYIKDSSVDKDNLQGVALAPGDYFEIPIPAGTTIDLNTVYVDADTATDGVCGGYITE